MSSLPLTSAEIRAQLKAAIKIESYPVVPTGGQTCGVSQRGVKLKCENTKFEVSVNYYRSELQNKSACLVLYDLFLMSIDL